MGKLRILPGKEICKILSENGFLKIRQKGSHIVMQKSFTDTTITIPVPNHAEVKIGTLQSIIRQSGLSKELFLTK
ncbi:type II toxin-antitoxin system HicA family toxin [Bacteroidota bacterium]